MKLVFFFFFFANIIIAPPMDKSLYPKVIGRHWVNWVASPWPPGWSTWARLVTRSIIYD